MVATALVGLGALSAIDGFSTIGAVMTARNALYVYWVAFAAGGGMRGRSDVTFILHLIGALAVVNAGLGIAQFNLPQDHWLNATTSDQIEVVSAVGRVRACGSFSFIVGMSDLAVIGCWAGAVLVGRSPGRPHGFVYILAALVCAAVTISRGGVISAGTLIVLCLASRPAGRYMALVAAVFGMLALLSYGDMLTDDTDDVTVATAVLRRHTTAGDTFLDRATSGYTAELPAAIAEVPFGHGMGQGQTGGRTAAAGGVVSQYYYEGEPARVVAEIGLIGFIGVFALRLGLPYLLFISRRSVASREANAVFWPTLWLLLLGVNMLVVFNHIQATFQAVALACLLAEFRRIGGPLR